TRLVDDCAVSLKLSERKLERVTRLFISEPLQQIYGHVCRRPEARSHRERAGARELRQCFEVDRIAPHDDRLPLDIDTAAASPARELRVLPRRQLNALLAVVLV